MTDNNKKTTLKEAFDAELLKRLEENPPEIPTYEEFSTMVDADLNKQRRRKMRIISIAASLAIMVLASIFAITYLTPDVDADKNPKEEIVTEDGVIIEDGGWGSSDGEDNVWSITDWDFVEEAKVVAPDILIPGYIPEGYEFEKLTIERLEIGATTCEYIFTSQDVLEIELRVRNDDRNAFEMNGVTRTIASSKGKIYLQEVENKIATIEINDGMIVVIWHNLPDQELIKVVDNLSN